MHKLELLVGDIQAATYSMMPATLARAPASQPPQAAQPKPVVPQQGQFRTKVRMRVEYVGC